MTIFGDYHSINDRCSYHFLPKVQSFRALLPRLGRSMGPHMGRSWHGGEVTENNGGDGSK